MQEDTVSDLGSKKTKQMPGELVGKIIVKKWNVLNFY